jgi:hypothetical protein
MQHDRGLIRRKLPRAFSAEILALYEFLGRCSRLPMIAAPLALKRSVCTAALPLSHPVFHVAEVAPILPRGNPERALKNVAH